MWCRYLHSCITISLLSTQAFAQSSFCKNEAAVDSAISGISRHYSYTGPGWQRACDSLLAICPDLDQVWQMKAMPNIKMGDWHGCFSNLAHAVALNPGQWLPYQAFLKCIFSKDYAGAFKEFRQCDSLMPGSGVMDHSFDFFRGLCCLGMKDGKGANFFLSRDVSNQEKYRGKENVHHVSLFYRGMYHYLYADYANAERTFRRCLKIYPQYPEPSYYLGLTLLKLDRKKEALACFQKAQAGMLAGYNSNEDQEFYVNYPYAIAMREIEAQIEKK